jgi:hypothetical protein
MTGSAKQRTLILLGLVIIITVIIAASLPGLELQPGMPLPSMENGQMLIPPAEAEPLLAISFSKFIKVIFTLLFAGSVIYVIYQLFRGVNLKDLGSYIRPLIISFSIAFVILLLTIILLYKPQNSTPVELVLPTPVPLPTSPLGPVPPLLLWLVGITLLVIGSLIVFWIFAPSYRRPQTIDLVGLEAKKAWQALKTGLDLKDVIVQCYRQMSLALEQEQGIERKEWMTTGEFEILLEAAGIPHDPVHQLTQLFEAVRYGDWQPNPADEERAIQCLQNIISYSLETKNLD